MTEKVKHFKVSKQALIYQNKQTLLISLHDVTSMHENAHLIAKHQLIYMLNSSINHEMLAPLRCIASITATLLEKILSRAAQKALKVIFNTANFVLFQVKNNLDHSLLEQNKLVIRKQKKMLKRDIVEPVIHLFMDQAKTQNVLLELGRNFLDCKVETDSVRLKQILINLVSNAIKFSRR